MVTMRETETGAYVVVDDTLLVRAFRSSGRRTWIVYREAGRIFGNYARGPESTGELAARLGVSVESIGNWAKAGWLREECRGLKYTDETGKAWTFYDLRQALALSYFQIAGRALHREAFGPDDIMEWLGIAATEGKSAEWLAAQTMATEENLFQKRLEKLCKTETPKEWSAGKKRAVRTWLTTGRELVEGSTE